MANARSKLETAISGAQYADFLDFISAAYYSMLSDNLEPSDESEDFRNLVNEKFTRHYSVYRMNQYGTMEDPSARVTEAAVQEARAILHDERFTGPDRQFQEAVLDFHRTPNPNFEGAVAGAVNAVEAMAKILLGEPSITLGKAIPKVRDAFGLHSALAKTLDGLYGYASDEGGRHGLVGDPKVDRPIAEFCLHQAAAAIVLFARLYGIAVVEAGSTGG
jgi:hypothetical protein